MRWGLIQRGDLTNKRRGKKVIAFSFFCSFLPLPRGKSTRPITPKIDSATPCAPKGGPIVSFGELPREQQRVYDRPSSDTTRSVWDRWRCIYTNAYAE